MADNPPGWNQLIWALERNRHRRDEAQAELADARRELRELLNLGQSMEGMTVTRMVHFAGISRETAHKLLREGA